MGCSILLVRVPHWEIDCSYTNRFSISIIHFSLNKIQDESQVAKEENAQAKEKTQEDACKVQVDPHPTIFNFEDIL